VLAVRRAKILESLAVKGMNQGPHFHLKVCAQRSQILAVIELGGEYLNTKTEATRAAAPELNLGKTDGRAEVHQYAIDFLSSDGTLPFKEVTTAHPTLRRTLLIADEPEYELVAYLLEEKRFHICDSL
jgi:hypothetical protein